MGNKNSHETGEILPIFQKNEDIGYVTISLFDSDKLRIFYETGFIERTLINIVK